MIKLLLATNNQGKLTELQSILAQLELDLMSPADLEINLQVKEIGKSYQENAILKATEFAKSTKMWSLADDSGLEVEILDDAPGLYSSRYAPQPGATDSDRRRILLQNLKGLRRPWNAHFQCVVALCGPDGSIVTKRGTCPGEIIPEERGTGGFGYDPIFLLSERGLTMAELPLYEKNTISHRARAVIQMIPILEEMTRREE